CEDTRVTGKLLEFMGLKKKLLPYNDHNADRQRSGVLEKLSGGARMALVSDAGTPLVSDPGYKLVRDALDLGISVTPVPGANALLPALQLSGLPPDRFLFAGFLPPKRTARRTALQEVMGARATLVFYETGPRLLESLEDMRGILGDRPAAVVREITKKFEEARRGLLSQLAAGYGERETVKGEIVILVAGAKDSVADEAEVEDQLRSALKTMSMKDAAAFVAGSSGQPKKKIYELALAMVKSSEK
ncbi:MAG: 16S rRNA (cytidine(1402)-2'-O)-methyltransferase, partial [Proteobacteria bacterium]|nr:16S rRNA (cytidine(1402)-2'-O)-methyltransferase [Pseudomonadota bacterium]